ncbi:hypothetical protein DFH09DRAFT_553933 [Mycena vulgaris]|nr:hypothetical protein DFH09DRAFT_553933 [Mycena vulgaris]
MHTPRCSECGADLAGGSSVEGALPDLNVTPGTWHHTLLNTNEPPEDSDVPAIQSFSATVGARLANLDQAIPRLQDWLRQLEEERTALSRFATKNDVILSPLRRIPPEVLAEILLWTLPSVRVASDRGRFNIADSPWVLTHVSSLWRAVSTTTPSFWSLVVIDYQPHNPLYINRTSAFPLPMLEAQIQRAQNLKIHFYPANNDDSVRRMEMFEFLVKQCLRWEEASIGATRAMFPLLTTLRDRVPLLADCGFSGMISFIHPRWSRSTASIQHLLWSTSALTKYIILFRFLYLSTS